MTDHICAACGTWFETGLLPPARCPICEDDRQYVPRDGQKWLSPDDLKACYANRVEVDDGVLGIGMTPAFAINQRCALVEAVAGTVMWETTSLVSDEAVAAILSHGPVTAIAISHPHFYAAMHCGPRHWIARLSFHMRIENGFSGRLHGSSCGMDQVVNSSPVSHCCAAVGISMEAASFTGRMRTVRRERCSRATQFRSLLIGNAFPPCIVIPTRSRSAVMQSAKSRNASRGGDFRKYMATRGPETYLPTATSVSAVHSKNTVPRFLHENAANEQASRSRLSAF